MPRSLTFLLLFYSTIIGVFACGRALAADVQIVSAVPQPDRVHCNLRLQGRIEMGDLYKLQAAIDALAGDPAWASALEEAGQQFFYMQPVLCLNSSGGSFVEGLKIAQHLLSPPRAGNIISFTTIIEKGAQCFSSCAMIFMAGKLIQRRGEQSPSRSVHIQGQLGFHAPYLELLRLQERPYTKREVSSAYDAAVSSLNFAMKIFSDSRITQDAEPEGRPWVRPSLFVEMLSRKSN